MAPAQINQNPVQGEFFTSAADLPERFVRETIQNSLDAAVGDATVRVRFAFGDATAALSPFAAERYLSGLPDHIWAVVDEQAQPRTGRVIGRSSSEVREEARAVYDAADLLHTPLTYLTVEDFGTRGLTGDVYANRVFEAGNNFWGFFRQIGISPKAQNAAGSWGLGKWVFPDASMINVFLALTRRLGESESLVMGLATLKTHLIDEDRYPPYGFFAAASDDVDTEWFPMPVSSSTMPQYVDRLARDFRLERWQDSGLSVIIPWPKPELTPASIARAVITQYFLPVVRGKLEVEISHPDGFRRITADTIQFEIGQMEEPEVERDGEETRESMRAIVELAQWAVTRDAPDDHIEIDAPVRGRTALSRPQEEELLAELQERFNRNERLAFKLNLDVQRAGAWESEPVSCLLYIQRDERLARGHDYFVRGNLQIPERDTLGAMKARTLLLVDGESDLGSLLRDAENPAHTNWQPSRERVKQNWEKPGGPIERVRLAPQRLVRALVERPAERDRNALADLFPADLAAARGQRSAAARQGSGKSGSDPPPRVESPPSPLRLEAVSDGFRVSANRPYPVTLVDTEWKARFAYELARGGKKKAFSYYEAGKADGSPDFLLEDGLRVELVGCTALSTQGNALEFRVNSNQFYVEVTGFDPLRDVLVEVDRIRAAAELQAGGAD